jgi:hypothetical protein
LPYHGCQLTKVVVGSSLAAIVAVLELSRNDRVTWVQTSGPLGGHFGGKPFGNTQIDLGMVALEPYATASKPREDICSPPLRQDGLGLVDRVFEWLKEYSETFTPIQVKTSFRREAVDDYLIRDHLGVFSLFSLEEINRIRQELSDNQIRNNENPNFHPRNKMNNDEFLSTSIKDFMIGSLGTSIYNELFEPWLNKFNDEASSLLPSRDHRSIWLPLFYPETILALFHKKSLSGDSIQRPFAVPEGSSISSLVLRLSKATKLRNVDVVKDVTKQTSFEPGTIFFTSTANTAQLLNIEIDTSYPEQLVCPIQIVSYLLPQQVEDDLIVNFVDNEIGPYRITLRKVDVEKGKLRTMASIEYGKVFTDATDEELKSSAKNLLTDFGIDDFTGHVEISRIGLKFPYGNSRIRVERNRNIMYDALKHGNFLGYPIDFGSSSFNDQVLLGLWAANGGKID